MKSIVMRLAGPSLTLLVMLAGCGGGGSGGGASTGWESVTGLVPAEPSAGEVLYADATVLRPLQEGAKWSYRGTSIPYTGALPISYVTETTQSAVSANGVTETGTNPGNDGPDKQMLSIAGGAISSQEKIDFTGKGAPQTVTFTELPSPVRRGGQFTILDQRYTDTAIDADGDGKADTLDVAIYGLIVDKEALTLPDLPVMQAIRVDIYMLSRVTYSSNGKYSPIVKASSQTWYVAGIGIVRQKNTVPILQGTDVAITDEQITRWDGITTGLGVMPEVAAVIPMGNSVSPGQRLWINNYSRLFAFPFGDHALLLTDAASSSGTLASRVDLRGNVQGSTLLPGLQISPMGVVTAGPNDVVYVEPMPWGAKGFGVTRISAVGELVGSVRGVTLDLNGDRVNPRTTHFRAAMDGTTLWLLWNRSYYNTLVPGSVPGDELVLRAYSLSGVPLTDEFIVDSKMGSNLQIVASGGQVLMTWMRQASQYSYDAMFGSASLGAIGPVQALATGQPTSNFFPTALRLDSYSALLWCSPPVNSSSTYAAGGVLLDSNLKLIRAGTSWTDERIPDAPKTCFTGSSSGSRIILSTRQTIGWLDTGTAPLASTPVNTVTIGDSLAGDGRQAVFADRVLVFTGNYGLSTKLVWLNKGAGP